MFQSRILSVEDIYRYQVIIEHAKLFKRTFVIPADIYNRKTSNIGNHINIAAVVKLLNKFENILILHWHYKKFNTISYDEVWILNKIPNVIFITDYTTELKHIISKLNNYQAFLSGYSDKVNYSKCSLKRFRFQRFEGVLMPDITVIMNKELKQFANGFDKDVEIDYDLNRIKINGEEIDRKPTDCESARDKLLLLGSANHLTTNSLHCALLSLMIGVKKVTLTYRNWTSKLDQLKNWLKEIGFKVEGNTIYNYDHDWENEAKIVYDAFDKYIKNTPMTTKDCETYPSKLDYKNRVNKHVDEKKNAQMFIETPTYENMNCIDVMLNRHSVRLHGINKNKDIERTEQIPNEIFEKAFECAKQAPSACNRQPCYFFLTRDTKPIMEGYHRKHNYQHCNPSEIIICCIDTNATYDDGSDMNKFNYLDLGLAVENMLLALTQMKVSTCIYNAMWDRQNLEKLKEYFKIPSQFEIGCFIYCGKMGDYIQVLPSARNQKLLFR